MTVNYNEFREKIDNDLARDLHKADDVLEVADFISKFQHLSFQNLKWVRSQNSDVQRLLTIDYLQKNNIKLIEGAKATKIYVNVKDENGQNVMNEKTGRPEFEIQERFDITQTTTDMSAMPELEFGKIRNYQIPEYTQLLADTIGYLVKEAKDQNLKHNYDELNNDDKVTTYIAEQSALAFSKMKTVSDDLLPIHQDLTAYIVNLHFGFDTSEHTRESIEKWQLMNKSSGDKVVVMGNVHQASRLLIENIEKEIDVSKWQLATVKEQLVANKASDISEELLKEKLEDRAVQTPQREIGSEFEKQYGHMTGVAKELGLDKEVIEVTTEYKASTPAIQYQFNEALGIANFIKLLEQVESENPDLIESKYLSKPMLGMDGYKYDIMLQAKFKFDNYVFEFNGENAEIKFLDGDELQDENNKNILRFWDGTVDPETTGDYYNSLTSSDLEDFEMFKEKILTKLEKLKPVEPEFETVKESSESIKNIKNNQLNQKKYANFGEALEAANQVSIVDFANAHNIALVQSKSKNRLRVEGYDSFEIIPRSNQFNHWASTEKYSAGQTANFAFYMLKDNPSFNIKTYKDAVNYINAGDFEKADIEFKREPFFYNHQAEVNDISKARDYLVDERRLDHEIVDDMFDKGLIRQNNRNNVVFPVIDDEKVVGAEYIGTYLPAGGERFKGMETSSSPSHGWNYLNGEEPRKLIFFESPVDLLSYMSLNKDELDGELYNTWFVSTHGVKKEECIRNYIDQAQNWLSDENMIEQYVEKTFEKFGTIENKQAFIHASIKYLKGKKQYEKEISEYAGKSFDKITIPTENGEQSLKRMLDEVDQLSKADNKNVLEFVGFGFDNDEAGHKWSNKYILEMGADPKYQEIQFYKHLPEIPGIEKAKGAREWDWNNEQVFQEERREHNLTLINSFVSGRNIEPINNDDLVFDIPELGSPPIPESLEPIYQNDLQDHNEWKKNSGDLIPNGMTTELELANFKQQQSRLKNQMFSMDM